jgi:hypothetical protein
MNLLLTGRAVSNVFDGDVPMTDEAMTGGSQLMLRGIVSQPAVGYLTQLEALRYCQVRGRERERGGGRERWITSHSIDAAFDKIIYF